MNEHLLNKLEYIIFEDEDFKESQKASSKGNEKFILQLLKERGLELTYPQFRSGLKEIFKRALLKKDKVLNDELSDDDLDKVVGGLSSDCFNQCLMVVGDPTLCYVFCNE